MSPIKSSEAKFLFEISGMTFHVVDFTAYEKISSPFEVNLNLASEEEVNLDDVVGKEALLTITGDETSRYFHGIIFQFMQIGSRGRFLLYKAIMEPSIRLLSLEQDCRIFQEKNVEDIIQQIFKDGKIQNDRFEFRLRCKYQPKGYYVQYRETDLNFISRLLEEEGIFYFFEHLDDKHILVFGDCNSCHKSIDGSANVLYHPIDAMVPEEEVIYAFSFSSQIHSGKYTLKDFNFEKPLLDLIAHEQNESHQNMEVYDYPGKYFDENLGKRLALIRLQELMAFKEKAKGKSRCARLTPGFTFSLIDHECEDFNREYLVLRVTHKGVQPQVLEEITDSDQKFSYHNEFVGIPSLVPFRPKRKTVKPFVKGVQTAIVVGPQGEEIYTDKYGRVKVQFHWDREGKKDEKSSCWIRVSQVSAGAGWGGIDIPRIGHEVIVDFIEGDPDRPIIIGRVYHGENRPPYDLPNTGMVSGFKSNTTPGGGGYNEISANDTKGKENITIHAQYDMNTTVEHDQSHTIHNNRTTTLDVDDTESVGLNQTINIGVDQKLNVGSNQITTIGADHKLDVTSNQAISVGSNQEQTIGADRKLTVGASDSINVSADRKQTVGANYKVIAGANVKIDSGANTDVNTAANLKLAAGSVIEITAGDSSIKIDASGVTISTGGIITETASLIKHNA